MGIFPGGTVRDVLIRSSIGEALPVALDPSAHDEPLPMITWSGLRLIRKGRESGYNFWSDDVEAISTTTGPSLFIEVEDTPFIAVEVKSEGEGPDRRLAFRLNTGDLVVAAGTQFMQPDLQVKIHQGAGQTAGEASGALVPAKS